MKKSECFSEEIEIWRQQSENNNFANFSLLDKVVSNGSAINDKVTCNEFQGLLPVFTDHLQKLQRSFENYFSEQKQYSAWVRQPFSLDTTTADINSPYTDDIIEL